MVVIASKHIFGGGSYSVAGSAQLRMVGQKKWPISEIVIGRAGAGARDQRGTYRPAITKPFLPERITDAYHPGGNSACYMIQTAHLMGCDPIYLLGFTLDSGTGYFFGLDNPVTRRRSLYDTERAIHWLRWYQSRYPGRAKLWPGWSGPIYEVLDEVEAKEVEALCGDASAGGVDEAVDVHGVEQLLEVRQDQPLHADDEQSLRDW